MCPAILEDLIDVMVSFREFHHLEDLCFDKNPDLVGKLLCYRIFFAQKHRLGNHVPLMLGIFPGHDGEFLLKEEDP